MEARIRPFTMADYDGVWQLWHICHVPVGARERREEIERKLDLDPDLFLVAEMNQVIMGTVMGAWDGRNGWVYNHAVDSRIRRMGVGSRLIKELEQRLKEKGARQINLVVGRSNFEAQIVYQETGFRIREDEVIMTKVLTGE